MKFLIIGVVVLLLAMQKAAQFLIYFFCILLFGYGSVVLLRGFRTWSHERRARRTVHAA
jgi:uncharacterized membrane protein